MAEPYRFDDFVVESVIGEGGMGRVYRARQTALDRWVALKVLPRARENPTFIERFYREARSAARLVHPNIIQIHTVGEHQQVPYYTMEYIEGDDLEHIIKTGAPLTIDEVVEIIRSVLKALVLANEHAIVHRDIKPANIMITKTGIVKVTDFGLAKGHDHGVTQAGLVVGTPTYMSPEQGSSQPVDVRSDMYSLGVLMYESIVGKPPFDAGNVASLIYKHMYEDPEPISKLRPDFSEGLEKICMKLMAKAVTDRYQIPEEGLEALAGVPSNPMAAEITLARRAQKCIQLKKQKQGDKKPILTPEDFLGVAPKPPGESNNALTTYEPPPEPRVPPAKESNDAITPRSPQPMGPVAVAAFLKDRAAAPGPDPSRTPPPMPAPVLASPPTPEPATVNASSLMASAPAAPAEQRAQPTPRRPPTRALLTPPPRQTEARAPASDSNQNRKAVRIDDGFIKLPDGRWTYDNSLRNCKFAEGIAAELRQAGVTNETGLSDCLLCSNWTRRNGCALAYCQELERQGRLKGLKLLVEQGIVWAAAGRFDKAVGLLDDYVKNNQTDPEGYRELARIYEHPEYRGPSKRRAIVLYQRFVELARRPGGGFSNLEIARAEERIAALKVLPPNPEFRPAVQPQLINFDCFYRGAIVCYGHGVLSRDRIVHVRAGEVDPESGITASEMGGAMGKATSLFRRFKSEAAKREEAAGVRKELARLTDLPYDHFQKDQGRVLAIGLDQILDVEMIIEKPINIRILTMKTQQQTHQLLFTEAAAFEADQCFTLMKRRLGK